MKFTKPQAAKYKELCLSGMNHKRAQAVVKSLLKRAKTVAKKDGEGSQPGTGKAQGDSNKE